MKSLRTICFKDVCPNVRYTNLMQCPNGFIEEPRRIYDHQFIYVHNGKGIIEIDGISYNTLPGDLFFYGPGVIHAFYADIEDPYLLSGIHFDFTMDYKDKTFPIGPFALESFRYELMTECLEFSDFPGFLPHINLSGDHRIREIILEMVSEYETGRLFSANYINGLFGTLLTIVTRHVIFKSKRLEFKEGIINQVIRFIHEHYNQELSNKYIAESFHFHPNYLNQLMVSFTGVSLRQYLIDFRIKKALYMIINTNLSIVEISHRVGYEDIHYFTRLFKKKTGYVPGYIKDWL